MRVSLTSRQLEILFAVIECGGFAAAGRSLSISQAAISQQVHAIEQKVGFRVFTHRPGSGSRLTTRGQRLVDKLPDLLQQLRTLSSTDRADTNAPTLVRIGCGDVIAAEIASSVPALYDAVPGIVLEIRILDPAVSSAFRLQDQDVDLAYFALRTPPSDHMCESIAVVSGGLYAPTCLPLDVGLSVASPLPLISAPENSALSHDFEQALRLVGVPSYKVVARIARDRDRLQLALAGFGAIFALDGSMSEYVASGALRRIGTRTIRLHRCRFIHPRRYMHPTIRRVESFLTRLLKR